MYKVEFRNKWEQIELNQWKYEKTNKYTDNKNHHLDIIDLIDKHHKEIKQRQKQGWKKNKQ